MKICRGNFVAAYLQGDLERDEVVYCHAPPGYASRGADGRPRVCRVDSQANSPHGSSRPAMATTLAVPLITQTSRLPSMRIGSLRLHYDAVDRRRRTPANFRLVR
eukprot:6172428-Pleurochrysis_carterae.AAC.7